jgi:hypothetical protein
MWFVKRKKSGNEILSLLNYRQSGDKKEGVRMKIFLKEWPQDIAVPLI